MKSGVYLAGKMEQASVDEMKVWRTKATEDLNASNITVYDPTRRIPLHTQILGHLEDERKTLDVCRRIFKLDLQDIANSTVVLADVRRNNVGAIGTGTAMELMFAHTKNKIIILWANSHEPIHPFLESIATEKTYSLEDALTSVKEYFDVHSGEG